LRTWGKNQLHPYLNAEILRGLEEDAQNLKKKVQEGNQRRYRRGEGIHGQKRLQGLKIKTSSKQRNIIGI